MSFEFDGCTETPCVVVHGTTATGRVTIKSNTNTNSLTCKLSALVGPIELPFDGCPADACSNLSTGDCAIEVGETFVWELSFEVSFLLDSLYCFLYLQEKSSLTIPYYIKRL